MKAATLLPGLVMMLITLQLQAQYSAPVMTGNARSVLPVQDGYLVKADHGEMLIMVYSPTIFRIRVARESPVPDFSYAVIRKPDAERRAVLADLDSCWSLATDSITLKIFKSPLRLLMLNAKGAILNEDYAPFPVTWQGTEVTSYKKLQKDEKFIGMGEKTGNLNRRGEKFENWNSDVPAYALKADPIYVSIPFYMGIHGRQTYGIFLDNTFRTKFDFAASTDDQFVRFGAADGELNYYFFGASTIRRIIEDYTWLTGRMQMPPIWSLGYQQCRWGYYPESEVMSLAQKFRDKAIPCDVIYFDIDYMDAYKIFTWHPERFPKPKEMIGKLNNMGFHMVTIVDPGIKIEKGYFAYDEGVENGYFATYPDGSNYTGSVWPGRCHFPDFTLAGVRQWWGNSFVHLTEPGVEGFWNDMNEPAAWGQNIPNIVAFGFEGRKGTMAEAHNIYGLNMSRATLEGTKKLMNGKRPFILTRAGYAGIQRYAAVWTGDNEATDEHMMLGVRLVNSMGLSGLSFVGPDMGGFMGQPTTPLYQRWLTIGVFTPFFRNHSAVGTKDKEPWSFGEDVEQFSREWISLRYRLLPYIYSAFYQSAQSGIPVARSLAIDYTMDEKIWWWIYQHQYLFGDNILVAPVSSTQGFAKVYLPEGGWYRMHGDQQYKGNQEVIVDATLNNLPVFIKASAIIPMQSVVQNTGEKPSPVLELHVYHGEKASQYRYYEDDGTTYGFETGAFLKRRIVYNPADRLISLEKTEGNFSSKFSSARLVLHGFGDIMQISANGKPISLKMKQGDVKTAEFELTGEQTIIHY
jgi:alpha-glucosidase